MIRLRQTPLRRLLVALAGLCCLCSSLAHGEVIRTFDTTIEVRELGTLAITERIEMDFEGAQRRGIYRVIPYRYQRYGNAYRIDVRIESVTDEAGNERPYVVNRAGGNVSVRIGDPDVYVTGRHIYLIRYTARRAVNFFGGQPEVYWNATGEEWPFPIERATARLILPENVAASAVEVTSFRGPPGSTVNAESRVSQDQVMYSAENLAPGSGLTIVAGLPAGSIERPTVLTRIGWWFRDWWPALVLPLLSLGTMLGLWYTRGRDIGGGQAIPVEWDPPEGLSPAEVGTLVDERCHVQDIVATIIDLAARGHLRIVKLDSDNFLGFGKADYQFIRTRPPSAGPALLEHEGDLLEALFDEDGRGQLSKLRGKFHTHVDRLQTAIYYSLTERGYFTGNPQKVRAGFIAVGVLMAVAGAALTFLLAGLGLVSFGIGLILAAVPVFVFGPFMPARTLKGSTALRESRGFRRFLMMVERERLAEAYKQDPTVFGRLLPYAMVLGVEDQWASQFDGLMDRPPEWFDSGHRGPFVPSLFLTDLGQGVSSMGTNLAARPASSGAGGGSSGFSSGGGFSGGGFGGGGGGSW